MILPRPAASRGRSDRGWLDAWHSFSFGDYRDPEHGGWGALRVLNEDVIAPGRGFGMHGHTNMEILTLVLAGELEHKDGLGNASVIRAGEVQHMSAGPGLLHSEFNPSRDVPLHLLQVWIEPGRRGVEPAYGRRAFPAEERRGRLRAIASGDGRDGSLAIQQDAVLWAALLAAGQSLRHDLAAGRRAYLHVVRGVAVLNGTPLEGGDGAKIADEAALEISAEEEAEILLFDLP